MKHSGKIGDEVVVVNSMNSIQFRGTITKLSQCGNFSEVRESRFLGYNYHIVDNEYIILF